MAALALAAIALLCIGALAAALTLRLALPGTVLAAYVVASAEVVLGAELLSPLRAIAAPGYLAWEAAVATAAAALWLRAGRPRPPLPRPARASLTRHPVVLVLAAAVALGLLVEVVLAVTTAPNNWDALTYHLSRAAAWYQRGSLGFFPAHTPRENFLPGNAEIQILYTMVFTQGDRLASMPQLTAELALLVGIFGIARRLGFDRASASFASLLFATLSEVALEATTAQNDLVVSAYVVAAACFLLGRSRREALLAALAYGLALGTKPTALYALPLLLLLVIATLQRRRIAELVAATAVAFAGFGSLFYVEDALKYGSPLGPSSELAAFQPRITAGNAVSSTARTLYRFVDFSGYDADIRVRVTLLELGRLAFERLHIDPEPMSATLTPFFYLPTIRANEDLSYFGPLGALLLLPLSAGYACAFLVRRTSPAKAALALALPLFAAELALTYKYNPWLGRFMILPAALAVVLAARVYALRAVAALCAVVGVLFLGFALAHNERKPIGLDGTTPVWSLGRDAAEGLVGPGAGELFQAVDSIVPAHARVGVLLGDDDWDYPLYGRHLTRQLVVLGAPAPFRQARERRLDWVVVGSVPARPAPGWAEAALGGWTLLGRDGTSAAGRVRAYTRLHPGQPATAPSAGWVTFG